MSDKAKSTLFHKRRPITPIQFTMNNKTIDVVGYFIYLVGCSGEN